PRSHRSPHLPASPAFSCTKRGTCGMKRDTQGYRVAVVGASSLLGKELLTVLEERGFPVARLITLGPGEEDPELPIVDLDGNLAAQDQAQAVLERAEVMAREAEVDLAFLAGSLIRQPP